MVDLFGQSTGSSSGEPLLVIGPESGELLLVIGPESYKFLLICHYRMSPPFLPALILTKLVRRSDNCTNSGQCST